MLSLLCHLCFHQSLLSCWLPPCFWLTSSQGLGCSFEHALVCSYHTFSALILWFYLCLPLASVRFPLSPVLLHSSRLREHMVSIPRLYCLVPLLCCHAASYMPAIMNLWDFLIFPVSAQHNKLTLLSELQMQPYRISWWPPTCSWLGQW